MHAVRSLADYVHAAGDREPTTEAREAAIRCIFDLVTAVVVGFDAADVPGVRRIAQDMFGGTFGGKTPIWFARAATGMVGAAWSNSAAASALDLDDGNRLARGHPGAAVIPAAFALASNASLDEIIKAIIVGYEVGVGVGAARRFWARTGMWSCYGVVAAAGLLRKTPPDRLAHAFAVAGMTAPNLLFAGSGPPYPDLEGNDVKEGIPWSTVTGIAAVLQAEAGMTGPLDVLDHADHCDSQAMIGRLGSDPYISKTYHKLYSCCRHIHAPVDALRALMERHGLAPHQIEAVEVHTYRGALRLANRTEPANLVDVQYSIPYCLGLAAILGPSALLPLTKDVLFRDDVSHFARKVTLHLDSTLDERFPAETLTRVVVRCGGRDYESAITAPRGEATDPLSWQDLEGKFVTASRLVATQGQQAEILDAARQLKDGDIAPLMACLSQMTFAGHV
jgi:2-methylcitrate dehydratase PrpD